MFQFESRGMRDLLKQAPPTRFEDIVALVALYRPGPMALIPDYIARKSGRERVDYPDPRLEPILGPTYGVMVYQEQVMQIAQAIGGYTLGRADLLRRAMGKKNVGEMAEQRDIFVAGAEANRLARNKATHLFDLMEKFAGYGFNKSHAAAYALVAYQTAYFKAHHPAAFMAANLSLVMDDTDKVRELRDDALAQKLVMLQPDVNASNFRFEPVDTKQIRYGLGGIKGTGEQAIASIVAAREAGGAFRDLFDFCRRVDKRLVNRRVVEALVRAGAFDAIDARRATLFASVGVALAEAERAESAASQVSLFGEEQQTGSLPLVVAREWTDAERLVNEKAALGYYLSGHPFAGFAAELAPLVRQSLASLQPRRETVMIAGIVTGLRVQTSRRGKMAFVTLDDGGGSAEIVVFNETFDAARTLLREDELVIVEAKVQQRITDDGQMQGLRIIAEAVYDLPAVRKSYAKALRLACNGGADAERLADLIAPFRNGSCRIVVEYRNHGVGGEIELPESWRVNPDEMLSRSCASGSRRKTCGSSIERHAARACSRAAACGAIAISCCCGARRAFRPSARAITRTALPMAAILVAGAGALDLGLLAVTLTLPRALLAWVGGGLVDRHRRRPVLIGADLVRCVALVAIPLAACWALLSLPLLYAIAAITGIATVLFELADHVFIADLVGRDQLLDANGKREAVDAVAEISGPALGGALVAWLTAPIAIAVDAATFVASALLIARIRKRETIVARRPRVARSPTCAPGSTSCGAIRRSARCSSPPRR